MPTPRIAIVGGGLAAAKAAQTLREDGHDGPLTIVAREEHRPYERPPLSKDYLRGEADIGNVFPLDAAWYADHDVTVLLGTAAVALGRTDHTVTLDDGRTVPYDRLLLATGSTPRTLGLPGAHALGVHQLRTIDDADRLSVALRSAHSLPARDDDPYAPTGRLVMIGDGWIGLEVAASARMMGLDVTVIGREPHPLGRVLGTAMSAVFAQLHTDRGVRFVAGDVQAIRTDGGRATGVVTDQDTLAADVVVIAVGATPELSLSRSAGLARDRATGGVAVSGTLATDDPAIFAAGDIASVPSSRYGRTLRVEHWATALHQGPHAAKAMLGSQEPYDRLPYFFTDQYDLGMEYLGYVTDPDAADLVISGSVPDREFVAFWVRHGRVEAGMAVNMWERMDRIEELIRRPTPVPSGELAEFAG